MDVSNDTRWPIWQRALKSLSWAPKRCRQDPSEPPSFSWWLTFLFALASAFTGADLFYSHPILNILAENFDVSYEQSSLVPTLMQAGCVAGIAFICPLGDVVKRRALIISLTFLTATLWIGLCITKDFIVFCVLSFLASMTSVIPMLLLPLVAGVAPPNRQQTAISIVLSGVLVGYLIARILSAVMTQYTGWRNAYWFALGIQYLLTVLLWLFMPDYPSLNPEGLSYPRILWSIVTITVQEPFLVQLNIVGFCIASILTSFWTVVTFLLASPPYDYSTVVIGLFALIGITSLCAGPPYSRYIMARFHPIFSVLLGEFIVLAGVLIGTFTSTFSVVGPVVLAFAIDFGMQLTQTASRAAIYRLRPLARNRINTSYTIFVFCGQMAGTAVGNKLYAQSGWVLAGIANIAFVGLAIVVTLFRGPWETGWLGWAGGWSLAAEKIDRLSDTGAEIGSGELSEGAGQSELVSSQPSS